MRQTALIIRFFVHSAPLWLCAAMGYNPPDMKRNLIKTFAFLLTAAFFAFLFQISSGVEASGQDPATARQLKEGARVFRLNCQSCHGREGDHPDKTFNLADKEWKHGDALEDIEKTVTEGVKGTAMLGFKGRLTPKQISSVSRYVYSFREDTK